MKILTTALHRDNNFAGKETFYLFLTALVTSLLPLSHGFYGIAASLFSAVFLVFIDKKWAAQILLLAITSGISFIAAETYRLLSANEMSMYDLFSAQLSLAILLTLNIFLFGRIYRRQSVLTDNSASSFSLPVLSFIVTYVLLFVMRLKAQSIQLLLIDRFYPQIGNFVVFVLSVYAAWMTDNLLNAKESAKWRKRLWLLFSGIFFTQFLLGISGFEKFMQTGKLHLPIPALVVGGPIYRGGGIFMAILLTVTLILVGPSWCSHLCYVGALDQYFTKKRKFAKQIPLVWRQRLRLTILILTAGIALLLNYLDASPLIAGGIAVLFAAVSIAVMMYFSSRTGVLIHCTSVCPIGWLTTFFGKINPFRIRLNQNCTDCQVCSLHCNYSALNRGDIEKRKPNTACTLCGDCVGACPHDAIEYRFLKMDPGAARRFFITLIVILHTLFIAVARV